MSGHWLGSRSTSRRAALGLLAILALGPRAAEAQDRLPKLYVGAGLIAHQILKTSGAPTGGAGPVGSVEPAINAAFRIPLSRSFAFMPSVAFTAFGRMTEDDSATVRLLPLSFDLVWKKGRFDVRCGPGVLSTIIAGEGGTVTLDNGTSTSTFARPSGTSTATTVFVGVGTGAYIGRKVRADGTLLMQALMSERRTFSIMGQVSYEVF